MADPTETLLRDLSDPAKFRAVERVSVFRPHKREIVRADGKKDTITVTERDLQTIAANMERAYGESGKLARLTLGHIKQDPNYPEHLQPPIVGFAKNYRCETVKRPSGTLLTVTHTEYLRADQADEILRQYPFRSPEYDPVEKTFGGVALLTRDPWLDTGAVYVYSAGSRFLHYQAGETAMADKTNYAQYAQQKAAWATAHKDEDGEVMGWDSAAQRKKDGYQADDDEQFTPEEEAQYARMARYMKKKYAKLAAYMDDPSDTNTDTAAMSDKAAYQKAPEYSALAAENLRLRVERELDQLAYQGVRFDRAVEMPKLIAMTGEDRVKHIDYMKTNYAKTAVNGGMIAVASGGQMNRQASAGAQPKRLGPDDVAKVIAYQKAHNVPYPVAVERYIAENL
jgi:hypothetical protein